MTLDILKKLFGFEECSTGGGCEALYVNVNDNGAHILVTNEDEIPKEGDKLDIGMFDVDGYQVDFAETSDYAEAVKIIQSFIKRLESGERQL